MSTRYDVQTASDRIIELLRSDKPEEATQLLTSLHPVDRASLFEEMDRPAQDIFLALLGVGDVALLFERLDQDSRGEVARRVPGFVLARVLDQMTNDDAADVLQTLSQADAERILANMRTAERVGPLLEHASDSAGGLMTPGYVELRPQMTAEEAISYLRSIHPRGHEAYYLYVLSNTKKLLGVVNLRELIVSDPSRPVSELMTRDVISVRPGTDQEECARLFQRYRLSALPVVDEEGILQGIITADDILDVLSREATEDMYKMAGVGVQEWAFSPLRESVLRRVPWLSFNMLWAFAGAGVISIFEGTLQRVATVAIFMPMIAGQAGNAGIQTATIVVRSMALGEVQVGDIARVLGKEWALGAIKGTIFGTALGLIAWIWKGNEVLGLVAGTALFCNMLVAATAGVLIPMTLRRIGFDPATIAGVFDTMLTDLMGFLIYLGLATILIDRLA